MTEIGFRSYSRHIDAYPCPSLAICYDFERDINNFLLVNAVPSEQVWPSDVSTCPLRGNLTNRLVFDLKLKGTILLTVPAKW